MEFALFSKFMRAESVEQLGQKVQSLGFSGIEFPVRPGYQCEPDKVSTTPQLTIDKPLVHVGGNPYAIQTVKGRPV